MCKTLIHLSRHRLTLEFWYLHYQDSGVFLWEIKMKLKRQLETEAYISSGGYYCIKQKDPEDGDSIVILSPEQLDAIHSDMVQYILDRDWWNSDNEASDEA